MYFGFERPFFCVHNWAKSKGPRKKFVHPWSCILTVDYYGGNQTITSCFLQVTSYFFAIYLLLLVTLFKLLLLRTIYLFRIPMFILVPKTKYGVDKLSIKDGHGKPHTHF